MKMDKHFMLEMWFKEIIRGEVDDYIDVEDQWGHDGDEGWESGKIYQLYTDRYLYHIVAKDRSKDAGYLGCQVSARKPRAGEGHTRGNDLPDGAFIRETWESIKNSIIRYELVKLGV